jgi:hypothetical protein
LRENDSRPFVNSQVPGYSAAYRIPEAGATGRVNMF